MSNTSTRPGLLGGAGSGFNPDEPRDDQGKWTTGGGLLEGKAINDKLFTKAKTIREAEDRIKKAGVANVNLKGLKPDEFNSVVNAIEAENRISPLNLSKLTTYSDATSSTRAFYRSYDNQIALNLSKLQIDEYTPKTYEGQLKEFKSKLTNNPYLPLEQINSYNDRIVAIKQKIASGETAKQWSVSSDFKDKQKQLQATIHHEIGHYRQMVQMKNYHYEFNKKNSVTEYGETNEREYFAEWYAHYRMNGEKGVPKDMLQIFKWIN